MTLPTPAPWMVTINHSFRTYQIWDEDGNYHDSDIPEREANRALIEAAPDLLAALIELDAHMMHEMPVGTYPQGTFEVVREAIAKATGLP